MLVKAHKIICRWYVNNNKSRVSGNRAKYYISRSLQILASFDEFSNLTAAKGVVLIYNLPSLKRTLLYMLLVLIVGLRIAAVSSDSFDSIVRFNRHRNRKTVAIVCDISTASMMANNRLCWPVGWFGARFARPASLELQASLWSRFKFNRIFAPIHSPTKYTVNTQKLKTMFLLYTWYNTTYAKCMYDYVKGVFWELEMRFLGHVLSRFQVPSRWAPPLGALFPRRDRPRSPLATLPGVASCSHHVREGIVVLAFWKILLRFWPHPLHDTASHQ